MMPTPMIMWIMAVIIAVVIRVPMVTPIPWSPPYGIPSDVMIRTIPWIVMPGVPIPWVVDIGYTTPVPWVVVVTTMEPCQAKTIVEVHVVTVGITFLITIGVSKVIEILCRKCCCLFTLLICI